MPWAVDTHAFESPHVKTHLLLQVDPLPPPTMKSALWRCVAAPTKVLGARTRDDAQAARKTGRVGGAPCESRRLAKGA